MPDPTLFGPDEATETGPALEEEAAPFGVPPEADTVAGRALMIGALVERARLEATPDATRLATLDRWVDHYALYAHLGAGGAGLFELELGTWADDDLAAVDWSVEELAMLLWALGRLGFPRLEVRANPTELVALLPIAQNAKTFFSDARLRSGDEIETRLALCDGVLEAVRAEVHARALGADPSLMEGDEALHELLEAARARGFKKVEGKTPAAEAIEALRFTGRVVLSELFHDEGPHLEHRIDSATLVGLDDTALATLLGTLERRVDALAWLVEGEAPAAE